ncbi:MAG TPA: flagellar biosynthetic protein FliQ [Candidatus Limnocylindria bacterium]|nr:flagellar biosynthetic protein FliQ [Candidatus Limnocylindria bacterium]
MTPELAVELLKTLVMQAVSLALPFLGAAMVIGLLVSLFQAVTTIHEQTLTFVPKALGVIGMLLILMPWLVRSTVEFTASVFEKIPQMAQ